VGASPLSVALVGTLSHSIDICRNFVKVCCRRQHRLPEMGLERMHRDLGLVVGAVGVLGAFSQLELLKAFTNGGLEILSLCLGGCV
jgi:hypothetical protein